MSRRFQFRGGQLLKFGLLGSGKGCPLIASSPPARHEFRESLLLSFVEKTIRPHLLNDKQGSGFLVAHLRSQCIEGLARRVSDGLLLSRDGAILLSRCGKRFG